MRKDSRGAHGFPQRAERRSVVDPMPTARIAQDDLHLAAYLIDLLQQSLAELAVIHVARNGVEAAERIAALEPDFAFAEIRLGPQRPGVRAGHEGSKWVEFVTANDEFAVAALESRAFDSVLKPSGRTGSRAPERN